MSKNSKNTPKNDAKLGPITDECVETLLLAETEGLRTCMRNGLNNDIAMGKNAESGIEKLSVYANGKEKKNRWLEENTGCQKSSLGEKRRLNRLINGYFAEDIKKVDPVEFAKISTSLKHVALSKMEARHKTDKGQWNKPGIKLNNIDFQNDRLILSFDHTDEKYNLAELKVVPLKALIAGNPIPTNTPDKHTSNKELVSILKELKTEYDKALQYISENGDAEYRAEPIPGLESVLDASEQEAEPKGNEEAQHRDAVPPNCEEEPSAIENVEEPSEQDQDYFEIEDVTLEAEASTPVKRRAVIPSQRPAVHGRSRTLADTPNVPSAAAMKLEAST